MTSLQNLISIPGVEVAPDLKGRYLQLKRLNGQIRAFTDLDDHAACDVLIPLAGLYPGDYATAGSLLGEFVNAGTISARRDDSGRVLYSKTDAAFPEWEDRGPGTEAFNEYLHREAERERRMLDEQTQREQADARSLNVDWQFHRDAIRQAVEPLQARITELEAKLAELTQGVSV